MSPSAVSPAAGTSRRLGGVVHQEQSLLALKEWAVVCAALAKGEQTVSSNKCISSSRSGMSRVWACSRGGKGAGVPAGGRGCTVFVRESDHDVAVSACQQHPLYPSQHEKEQGLPS